MYKKTKMSLFVVFYFICLYILIFINKRVLTRLRDNRRSRVCNLLQIKDIISFAPLQVVEVVFIICTKIGACNNMHHNCYYYGFGGKRRRYCPLLWKN